MSSVLLTQGRTLTLTVICRTIKKKDKLKIIFNECYNDHAFIYDNHYIVIIENGIVLD